MLEGNQGRWLERGAVVNVLETFLGESIVSGQCGD